MIGSSFLRNKPIIWETFGALFSKVIDMTRLYILTIFYIKNRLQIYLKFLHTIQEKRQGKVFLPLPGVPLPFFFILIFCWQKMFVCFFLYWCFCLHWLKDSVSPVCGISFILYLRWALVIFYRYVSFGKIIVLAFLHTLEIIHS